MDEPEFMVYEDIRDDQAIYNNVEVYTDTDGNFCDYSNNVGSNIDVGNTEEIIESNSQASCNLFEPRSDVCVKLEQPDIQENEFGTTDDESMAVEALRQLGNSTYSKQNVKRIKTTTPLDLPLLPCSNCNLEFRTTADLNAHEEICRESSFICPICCESFDRQLEMNNHLVCHAVDRPHACRICGNLFVHKKDLQLHMQTHGANTQNQCQICSLQFNRPSSLTNHLKIHAYQPGRAIPHDLPSGELPCEPIQKITLPSIHNITMHNWNLSFEPDNFQPEISLGYSQDVSNDTGLNESQEKKIKLMETNNLEVEEQHSIKPYKCHLCAKRFAREKALLSHLILHKNVFDKTFNCERCDQNFVNQTSLDKHTSSCNIQNVVTSSPTKRKVKKLTQNNVNKAELTENKPVVAPVSVESSSYESNVYSRVYKHSCEICGKYFSTKQKLFRHVWIHRKKLYSCEVCDKQFEMQHLLDSHRLANHQSISPYVCTECGKNFTTRQGLWEHNRIHTVDINSFKCDECSKTFTSRQGYLIHQRKHKGERPYGCRFCWKAFRDGGTLRKHERIHTGERPHACPLCSKAFNQKVVLREHIRMLHTAPMEPNENGQYVCTICNANISDKDELCVHIVRHSDQMAQLAKDASKNNITAPDEQPSKRLKRIVPKVEVVTMEQHNDDSESVDDVQRYPSFEHLNEDSEIIDHKMDILDPSIENNIEPNEVEQIITIQSDGRHAEISSVESSSLAENSIHFNENNAGEKTQDPIIKNNGVENVALLGKESKEQKNNFTSVQCEFCGVLLSTRNEFNTHIKTHI